MHAGVGPIHEVDEPAVVHLDVVGLDGNLARLHPADPRAALVGVRRGGRNVEPDFRRPIRIADVQRPDPGVEVGNEQDFLVVDRREGLVARVRTESPAAVAEIPAGFRDLEKIGFMSTLLLPLMRAAATWCPIPALCPIPCASGASCTGPPLLQASILELRSPLWLPHAVASTEFSSAGDRFTLPKPALTGTGRGD
jgi:hypothetical protein